MSDRQQSTETPSTETKPLPLTMSAEMEAKARRNVDDFDYGEDGANLLAELDATRAAHAETLEREKWVRRQLWLGHGHDGLYGDDGEMQCNLGGCLIDFRRDPIEDIVHKLLQMFATQRDELRSELAETRERLETQIEELRQHALAIRAAARLGLTEREIARALAAALDYLEAFDAPKAHEAAKIALAKARAAGLLDDRSAEPTP
jgi:hypothetical protein